MRESWTVDQGSQALSAFQSCPERRPCGPPLPEDRLPKSPRSCFPQPSIPLLTSLGSRRFLFPLGLYWVMHSFIPSVH